MHNPNSRKRVYNSIFCMSSVIYRQDKNYKKGAEMLILRLESYQYVKWLFTLYPASSDTAAALF